MFLADMALETLPICPYVTALVTCEVLIWVDLTALLTARLVHNLPDPGSLRGLLHLLADLRPVDLLPSHRSGYSSLLLDFLNSFILDPDMSKEVGPFQRRHQPFIVSTQGFNFLHGHQNFISQSHCLIMSVVVEVRLQCNVWHILYEHFSRHFCLFVSTQKLFCTSYQQD